MQCFQTFNFQNKKSMHGNRKKDIDNKMFYVIIIRVLNI